MTFLQKNILYLSIILITSTNSFAQIFNIQNNWQLLGTIETTHVSKFNHQCVDFIWKYSIDDENPWKLFVANGHSNSYSSSFETFDIIKSGEGFWLKGNSTCSIDTNSNVIKKTNAYNGGFSYDDFYYNKGQNHDYSINWDTLIVTDHITGYMWQNDNETLTPVTTYQEAVNYCENLSLGGYDDWKVPSMREQFTLIDIAKRGANLPYFQTEGINAKLWTSTQNPSNSDQVYIYNIDNGDWMNKDDVSPAKYLKCVRNTNMQQSIFIRDDTLSMVKDISTGLLWEDRSLFMKENTFYTDGSPVPQDSEFKTWSEAIDYCENLNFANRNDWRLPNINELISLFDYETMQVNESFLNINVNIYYWSSSAINSTTSLRIYYNDGSLGLVGHPGTRLVKCVADD